MLYLLAQWLEFEGLFNLVRYQTFRAGATLLTARIGFARTLFVFDNQGLGFKPSQLGLPVSIDNAVDRQMFPAFGASNYVTLGGNILTAGPVHADAEGRPIQRP